MRLEYQIAAVGDQQLKRVLRSIEAEATASARRGASRDQRSARTRVSTARTAARSELAIERSREQAASRARAHEHRMRMLDLAARERAIKRETLELRKQNREIDRQIMASKRRSAAMERDAHRAQIIRQRTAGRVMAGAGRVAHGTAGVIGGGIRTIGGIAGIGAGIAVASSVQSHMRADQSAAGIANRAAMVPGETRSREELRQEVMGQASSLETLTGRSRDSFLEGMSNFLGKTGDFQATQQLIGQVADVADAMGMAESEMVELAQAAGIAYEGLRKSGYAQEEAIKQTEALVRAQAGQSAIGQINMGDLASIAPTLLAAASRVGGDGSENLAMMTALANISVATASASPAEAATAVQRLTGDLIKGQKKIKKLGVDVFDERGQLRDFTELLPEIIQATGGRTDKLMKAGFGERGIRAIEPLANIYNERGGGQAGIDAVLAEISRYASMSLTGQQVTEGADAMRATDARELAKSFAEIKQELAREFVPVLRSDIIPALRELKDPLVSLTKSTVEVARLFSEHPWAGLGAIVGGFMVKELASAYIGAKVSAAITAAIAGKTAATAAAGTAAEVAAGTAGAAGKGVAGRAALGVAGATAGLAGGLLYGAYELSKPAMETMRENEALVGAGHFNAAPYAAPGMIAPESLKRDSPDGIEAPREFKKIREESAEKMDKATDKFLSGMDRLDSIAKSFAAIGPSINRTNPMNKRGTT